MAKYRVLVKSFINASIYEEGDVVEYDGQPGSNLEPLEEKPKGRGKAKAEPAVDFEAADEISA